MATNTTNYNLILPGVNDPTDQDLWGGYLNENFDTIDTVMKANEVAAQLPVGSLYFNADDGTNPASLLGYGTWVAFGAGRVPIGVGTGTDENAIQETFAAGDTGGEYEHVQTVTELAEHFHVVSDKYVNIIYQGGSNVGSNLATGSTTLNSQTTGDSTPMPWMQPYIAVYIWKRTA